MNNTSKNQLKRLIEILLVSTKLGLTSFGGPIAHLGYFHHEYIRKRKWLDEQSYADLIALCQFLPGPASSQVGIGLGVMRAGVLGGILAFIGFTLPSCLALSLFALILKGMNINNAGWIHGLKIVAVVVIAQAIIGMAQQLTPDLKRKLIALLALVGTLLWQTTYAQVVIILISALFGYLFFKKSETEETISLQVPISRRFALFCLALFFGLLFVLPILREITSDKWLALFDRFYRSGSLVFGGGHVVLPLLEREFVPTGWITKENFLAGYGAAQAVPGPLFTFASYLGTLINGWKGGLLATIAIFLPAFLLIIGTLPFWDSLRKKPKVRGALLGVNAAVVGILISSFYSPIWISSIMSPLDFALGSILFTLLVYWKLPPWIIVLLGALGGSLTTFL
ncbi:chromate transporter [Cytobacillus sp. Hz8]|uniref:chromate transporter n=1 Tax=Cytobacillus sp. Hz8 TaxID=3347168 RepID=UPI0035DEDE52